MLSRRGLATLQIGVGAACLLGAAKLLLHDQGPGGISHGVGIARGIASLEVIAVFVFWIPRGRRVGGLMLIASFSFAAGFHVWMGEGLPLPLVAYASAVLAAISVSEEPRPEHRGNSP